MAKRRNPLFQKTSPATDTPPAVVHPDPEPLNETFPGGLSIAPPLSKREQKRLSELEGVVTRNFKAFYEVGCALREINESQLYRETHDRFDEYVKDLWDIARRRAYQYIEAADVMDNIKKAIPHITENVQNFSQTDVLLPINDSQARALAKYDPEKQIDIWREALQTAKNGKITASHVRATAEAMSRNTVKRKLNKTKQQTTRAPRISDTFLTAFQAFLDQINAERAAEWKHTDPKEIARYLRGLVQAVEAPL